jgi:hypothetical protein
MQIKVNERTIEIYAGARVRDVLRKYSHSEWTLVRNKEKKVTDSYGHEVGLDGELNDGEKLVIKRARSTGSALRLLLFALLGVCDICDVCDNQAIPDGRVDQVDSED